MTTSGKVLLEDCRTDQTYISLEFKDVHLLCASDILRPDYRRTC